MTGTMAPPSRLDGMRILVVDDEPDIRRGIATLLRTAGAAATTADSAEEALRMIDAEPFELIVTDIKMSGMSGVELLAQVARNRPGIEVVLVTGFGTITQAVECLQNGAAHFLSKPFDNDELLAVVGRIGRRIAASKRSENNPRGMDAVVTQNRDMVDALSFAAQAAATRVPVLICGESGTGKELVARAVHESSVLRDKPFLAVNCAALPDALLESELFGYRKGAFTGAHRDHRGLFAQAAGGSVFLDEISSMSLAFQGKLLRVLQERVVRPLGAVSDEKVDFRLIAATNRDLTQMTAARTFREDLYYRLCVVAITLPPLRDRPDDIPLLAAHFLARAALECMDKSEEAPEMSDAAMDELMSYSWPGNVRELENTIQRALIVCRERRILPKHLLLGGGQGDASEEEKLQLDYDEAKSRAMARFQRSFVTRALERTQGNISRAAAECGLTRVAFQKILKALKIDRREFSGREERGA